MVTTLISSSVLSFSLCGKTVYGQSEVVWQQGSKHAGGSRAGRLGEAGETERQTQQQVLIIAPLCVVKLRLRYFVFWDHKNTVKQTLVYSTNRHGSATVLFISQ